MEMLLSFASYGVFFLTFAAIFAVIVLGLNLQWGFTGLFNVGVAGFVAVGAYTSAILTAPDYPESTPFERSEKQCVTHHEMFRSNFVSLFTRIRH